MAFFAVFMQKDSQMNNKLRKLKDIHQGQFQYLGRWVDKDTFRAYVYDKKENEKLANSYNEFEELISSGLWFAQKPVRKQEDVVRTAS